LGDATTPSVAFSNASEALSQLGIPDILPTLHQAGVAIKRSILGGSHSVVTYPPLNALSKVEDSSALSSIIRYGAQTSLYIHIAFCETECTFCHYAVRKYRGQEKSSQKKTDDVVRYLSALEKEIESWGRKLHESGTTISSVYIGGGTPLILETEQLRSLLAKICEEFTLVSGIEICVEGSPLTILAPGGHEKLQALKLAGVTRFSFGVQSFNNEVLKRAARGYKRAQAYQACMIVNSVFENWNLDLIQSLYMGTPEEVWENLEILRLVRPPHITWYHGRFAARPQGDWLSVEGKREHFEGELSTLLGRMLIWRTLVDEMGYHQVDGNRFVRDPEFEDPFKKTRTSVGNDLLGLGASSYSHVDERTGQDPFFAGWFFRNHTDIAAYVEAMESGRIPIGTCMPFTPAEHLAASYVIGLRTGRTETEYDRKVAIEEPTLAAHYRTLVGGLEALGLLERFQDGSNDVLHLTLLGRLFEDEILSAFYSPDVLQALSRR